LKPNPDPKTPRPQPRSGPTSAAAPPRPTPPASPASSSSPLGSSSATPSPTGSRSPRSSPPRRLGRCARGGWRSGWGVRPRGRWVRARGGLWRVKC